jgi:hypothetical protein
VRGGRAAVLVALVLALTGCSGDDAEESSVFSIEPGQCFQAPDEPEAQIADLDRVDCAEPHDHESYAVVPFRPPGEEEAGDEYPGDEALTNFADGACAQEFREYVGVDYLDSELFFTYLAPSPRSWQEDDRSVICLVTAAGRQLEGSVEGTGR